MFYWIMSTKGFTEKQTNIDTPNDVGIAEKLLKTDPIIPSRVDINVLKSKLQETESKEFKKNVFILSVLVLGLAILGVYFSI